jgi:hypothetical protein
VADNTDFEAAFAEFSSPEKAEDKPAEAAPAEAAAEEKPAEGEQEPDAEMAAAEAAADAAAPVEEAKPAEAAPAEEAKSAEAAAEAAPVEEAKPAEAAPVAAAPDADAILDGLRKLVGDAKPAEAAPAGEQKAEEKPVYTQDEQEFLTTYEKEWEDVSRGEALKRRAEYQQLLGYVFDQVANYMKPFQEMTETIAERTHRQDIESNVTDYSDKLRDDVISWVKTQPAYLQNAYSQVITEGTVDEVKDLVDRYRTATGQGAPAPKPASRDNELSEPAKQAAAALAPVESKRAGVQQPSDPSNFDDAWKQFSASI